MKNTTRCNVLFAIGLIAILFIGSAFSTDKNEIRQFRIEIEKTNNGLKLVGQKGTAFKQLSFTLRNFNEKAIDEFGMTAKDTKPNANDDKLADFEFTIEKVRKEYVLISRKGTTWTRVNFTFSDNKKVVVDQNGVTVE